MLPLAIPLVFTLVAGVFFGNILLLPSKGVVEEAIVGAELPAEWQIDRGEPDGGVGGRPVEGSGDGSVVTAPSVAESLGLRNIVA